MKLVTLNNSIVGIFVRATEDTENNTLRTEQGNTALTDSDTVEIISLTEDELETVKEYVDDIANGAQVSAFFEVSDGPLSKNLEAILIDVRSPRSFKQYSLHDSFNFPLSTLEHNWKILKSFDRPLILICDDGELCSKAKKILTMKNVEFHIGGDWKNFL